MIEIKGHEHDKSINFLKPTSFRQGKTSKSNRSNNSKRQSLLAISWPQNKRRKSIPKVSPKRKLANIEYAKTKKEWKKNLEEKGEWRCAYREAAGTQCSSAPGDSPHHKRGRGRFLSDSSLFLPVCGKHHDRIHANPKDSYERGYMLKRF